jgi:hypothetical protein
MILNCYFLKVVQMKAQGKANVLSSLLRAWNIS